MMKYCYGLALLCLSLLACAPTPAATRSQKKAPPASPGAPANLGIQSQSLRFTLPDPKYPGKGFLLLDLTARKLWGQFLPGAGIKGSLTGVSATLYQKGRKAAKLVAPKVQGDNMQKMVVASGGVKVTSLVQPGTFMTADKVIWYPGVDHVVASGHVFYKDGKSGGTVSGNRLIFDTRLQTFSS